MIHVDPFTGKLSRTQFNAKSRWNLTSGSAFKSTIEEQDHKASVCHRAPAKPASIAETGLDQTFINDLILKNVLHLGDFSIQQVVDLVKLPLPIVEKSLEELRRESLIEIKGSTSLMKLSYRYAVTNSGRNRGASLFEISRYIGPAPVTLAAYWKVVSRQSVMDISLNLATLKKAFSKLVVGQHFLSRIGTALCSGRPIFLYGPPGNGKTSIAETIGSLLPDQVFMPHALLVNGEIIVLFDPATHIKKDVLEVDNSADQRWIAVKRPAVRAGGELSLKSLDLNFDPISRFYTAPLQLKANNGLFIIDDLGRQQMDPQELLNRWIVPLEERKDLLTLNTGSKLEVPFDQLIIFATNLQPQQLADDAFLRRLRYKICVARPDLESYEKIFKLACHHYDMLFDPEVFDFLVASCYRPSSFNFNACEPRAFIEHILDDAKFNGAVPQLTKEKISEAWRDYFVHT
ncbi:MAG: ATPase [Desulfobacterales bacterium]|nr:MAG: ATPase [Desulfobacterales bacterium]